MKFRLSAAAVLVFLAVAGFASPRGVSIKADTVSYTKDKGVIVASGSVEASYKGSVVTADRIIFFTAESQVIADGDFTLSKDKARISGKKLAYYFRSEKGSASDVTINLGSTWIRGSSIDMDREQIRIADSEFSSCGLDEPHYKMSSANMTYYSKSGWIVQNWGLFWLGDIPVFPVPTYVYDTGLIGGFYKKKNPVPLPEIGSNDVDGFYLNEKFIWRLSSYSYGILGLNYGSKKGIGAGLESNYVLNDSNDGGVRISTYGSDGLSWGATHTYYFGDPVPTDRLRPLLYEVLEIPPRKKYDITLDLSYRERINYERVTLMPMVTLRYIDVPFSFLDFNPRIEASVGSVSEESSGVNLLKTNLKSTFDYVQPVSKNASLRAGLDASYTGYGRSSSWLNLLGRLDLSNKFSDNVEAGVGYSHYFINNGASPFNYENYRYFPYDDIRSFVSFKALGSTFGIAVSYNSPLLTVRDIDYNATVGLHCFDATLTWRAARQEFAVSLNLVSD
ncbi:MAG: LptA/OstA family protein [Candidatus Margulisiibacteriota bacterium]